MVKRILAIGVIFAGLAVAWMVLGATIFMRTESSRSDLRDSVVSNWGAAQAQKPPDARHVRMVSRTAEVEEGGRKVLRTVRDRVTSWLPLERSRIAVALALEHRQKGLLWYNTYKVAFEGTFTFRNDAAEDRPITFGLDFPATEAIYDDLTFTLDDRPLAIRTDKAETHAKHEPMDEEGTWGEAPRRMWATATVAAGKTADLRVAYRSQGIDSWRYNFGDDVSQVRDFELRMATDFTRIDFPANTLSPTEKRGTPGGWDLTWRYLSLVSGFQIGMVMPDRLQPGPLAGRISLFAPVSLYFFFFLMFVITTLRRIELHPMNYLFLGCAFFSFHLLLAYLVDHISIHRAFVLCSVVSIALVVSYLRLVVGMRFALLEAGVTQLIYLVLFSYAFFFKGYTGLAIAIGSVLSLFVVMQITGRVRWSEKFAGKGD